MAVAPVVQFSVLLNGETAFSAIRGHDMSPAYRYVGWFVAMKGQGLTITLL